MRNQFFAFTRQKRAPKKEYFPLKQISPASPFSVQFEHSFSITTFPTELIHELLNAQQQLPIKSQLTHLFEEQLRFIETFEDNLSNHDIDPEEKTIYVEEILGKDQYQFFLKQFQIKELLFLHMRQYSTLRIKKLKELIAKINNDAYDYDVLYLIIYRELHADKAATTFSYLHEDYCEEALGAIRPHCENLDKFCSRYGITNINFATNFIKKIPMRERILYNLFDELNLTPLKYPLMEHIQNFSFAFSAKIEEINQKCHQDQKDICFTAELINILAEAHALKEILQTLIDNIQKIIENNPENSLQNMAHKIIELFIHNKIQYERVKNRKYRSLLPPPEQLQKKILKEIKHTNKENNKENNLEIFCCKSEQPTLELASLKESLEIHLSEVHVISTENKQELSNASAAPTFKQTYKSSRPQIPPLRISTQQKAKPETYFERMNRRLHHSSHRTDFISVFEKSQCELSTEALIKIVKLFEGDVISPGKTTGSRRRIVLPYSPTLNEVKPTQIKTSGLHLPHGLHHLRDKAPTRIVMHFAEAFRLAGLTPATFGLATKKSEIKRLR